MLARWEFEPGPSLSRRWAPWILAAILALLFHALLLFPRIPSLLWFSPSALKHPRVDLHQVDPRKLEQIRKQWQSREKALLLDKNLHSPTSKEAPPDARYMSDRNIRVEKEQRAKQTAIIPKPGAPGEHLPQPQAPKTAQQRPPRLLPSLGNLGVKLPPAPKEIAARPNRASTPPRPSGDEAGSQYLKDPSIPEGSENLLNAQESVYYSFYSRIYDTLAPIWKTRIREATIARGKLLPGEYTTTVDAVYDHDGNLVSVEKISGSGIEEFDRVASASFRAVGRVPNPPEGLLNSLGQVHIGWSFSVLLSQGFNVESLPPERVY